jgi:pimeloyl-ACP methyl ester carboxylesterase
MVPLAVAEAVAGAMPSAELVVLPDTGHVPTMTRPERVAAEIDRWAAVI